MAVVRNLWSRWQLMSGGLHTAWYSQVIGLVVNWRSASKGFLGMLKFLSFCAMGGIVLIAACSSNNGVDTGVGAGASVGGTGLNNNGGAANGTSNNGTGNTAASAGAGNSTAGGNGTGTVGGTGSGVGGDATQGTGGSTVCGTGLCGPTNCGQMVDACGNAVDCGYGNCVSQALCGTVTANVCTPCTLTDCATVGANCGTISDGCGGTLDCGTCSDQTQCCGCGQPGVPNVCGTGTTGGGVLPYTCIAGTKGCICDSTGACAPNLSCTPQAFPTPNLCCAGADCAVPSGGLTIATCTGTGVVGCNPGITIPTGATGQDNCGYPSTSFNESQFICGIVPQTVGNTSLAQVQAFFNDEMSMTLGCAQNGYTVSAMPADPGAVYYPNTGDPACDDTSG